MLPMMGFPGVVEESSVFFRKLRNNFDVNSYSEVIEVMYSYVEANRKGFEAFWNAKKVGV